MVYDIARLPDEILTQIMSYLSLVDLKNARLVCHHWNNVSYAQSLIKNDVYVVKTCADLSLFNMERKYTNLRIRDFSESQENCLEFWQKCGGMVKSLELYRARLCDDKMGRIVPFLTNLKHILLSAKDPDQRNKISLPGESAKPADQLSFPFPNLTSLELLHYDSSSVSIDRLKALVTQAPVLKNICIQWYLFWYVTGVGAVSSERMADFLIEFAQMRGNVLEELNFNFSPCAPQIFCSFPHIGPQLKRLHLRKINRTFSRPEDLEVIAKSFPNLKALDLGMHEDLSGADLSNLISKLKFLTHISLDRTGASSLTISSVAQRHDILVALDLSSCRYLDCASLTPFQTNNFPKLIDLRLGSHKPCHYITDSVIAEMVLKMTNLIFLSLSCCVKLSDSAVEAICTHLPRLRSLSFQNCTRLKNVTQIKKLRGLIHLDFHGCTNLSIESMSNVLLVELQTIDLSRTEVTVSKWNTALSGQLPSLQDAYLDVELKSGRQHLLSACNETKFHFGMAKFQPDPLF